MQKAHSYSQQLSTTPPLESEKKILNLQNIINSLTISLEEKDAELEALRKVNRLLKDRLNLK